MTFQLTDLLDRERVFLVNDFDDGTLETLRKRENELLASYIGGEKLFGGTNGERIATIDFTIIKNDFRLNLFRQSKSAGHESVHEM